ncbi:MAG: hypothetical protein Q7U04_13415 [Bacteriovorax sp.]|nr:hypothetical protein [Bacteriovorax sp.]
MTLESKTLIVAHDAGGAEVLSAWVKRNIDDTFIFHLNGPAKKIFLKKLPIIKECSEDEMWRMIDSGQIQLAFTASSFISVEKAVITTCLEKKIKVITLLDHWVHLRERFGFPDPEWSSMVSDEVWCGDEHVFQLCKDLKFPVEKLKIVNNCYWDEIKEEATQINIPCNQNGILYIAEPVREHSEAIHGDKNYLGYDEYSCLEYFFDLMTKLGNEKFDITIRPHPSEEVDKYFYLFKKHPEFAQLKIELKRTLIEDCLSNRVVVGADTMGLVIGIILGKLVFTTIPPEGKKSNLPFSQILPLTEFNVKYCIDDRE